MTARFGPLPRGTAAPASAAREASPDTASRIDGPTHRRPT
jgi:hypothetical protein